ncbi:MAG: hypothetical protein V3T05_09195 [Myxococcota bacterium]
MSILLGVHPGGRNKFAVCALFYSGRFPAMVVRVRSHSGVEAVLQDIIGVVGEWGELDATAVNSPLTWSGAPNGWRDCDSRLRQMLPAWAPRAWVRPPNSLAGAVAVQGPALAWALAQEVKRGLLPKHKMVETHSRVSLANVARHMSTSVIALARPGLKASTRRRHIARLVEDLVDAGLIKLEVEPPDTVEELAALVCAITALGAASAESGLVVAQLPGGDIRPIGKRPVVVLQALP